MFKGISSEKSLSEEYFCKASHVMPGGVSSPIRACLGMGINPPIVAYAFKDKIVDADGREYIDYCGSWGALIHGHAHPNIVNALTEAVGKGTSYGLTAVREIEYAQYLTEILPHVNKVRFVSSGTEATMTAVRLARAVTGRSIIVKFEGHYHGHADTFLEKSGSALLQKKSEGHLFQGTVSLPYNDIDSFINFMEDKGHLVAGLIFEPIAANMSMVLPKQDFLKRITEISRSFGVITIADEVITGFRLALQGARALYEFSSDLTVLGKVVGGGLPIAAVGGDATLMDHLMPKGNVFQAGTLSGNPIAVEAGLTSLSLCMNNGFYERLEEKTNFLLSPVEDFIIANDLPLKITRKASMFGFCFGQNKEIYSLKDVQESREDLFKKFFLKLYDRGIYISPSVFETCFVSMAHSQESLRYTTQVILEVLSDLFL